MNLKSLLPSFIVIGLYFLADEFLDPAPGLCAVIFLGLAEFCYVRIKEKRNDKMVLLTVLFFCIPGLFDIWFGESALARLQPAIVETILCLFLGIFAFTRIDPMTNLPAGFRQNLQLSDRQLNNIRKTIRILFYILCGHNAASYLSTLYLPPATAEFIGKPVLYLLLGGFFLVLLGRNRYILYKMKKEEWLPLVDEQGKIVGKAPRSRCHSGSKLLHPVVHLHILNDRHSLFLQKRSMKKDLLPGMWDTAVGGHIGLGEQVGEALKREAFEELGITDFEARFLGNYIWESERERELVFSFLCIRYDRIHIDNDEVDEGRFWSPREIEAGIGQNLFTPNFIHEYRLLLQEDKHPDFQGARPDFYNS